MVQGYGVGANGKEAEQVLTRGIMSALMFAMVAILAACGGTQPASAPTGTGAAAATPMGNMPGMDHGSMASADAPYDAQFIDSMIVHHEGAIAMAKQALTEAERPEITAMAQAIVTAQEGEIAQLKQWRQAWYPDLATTSGMGMDMGTMEIAADASTPFDQRFIAAMIPHHEGAIAMAKDAQQKAEHQEIKTLAQAIITAQEGEIAQMKQWQQAWFGQ